MLLHPWIGVLYWVWFGLMNPHRLSWGLAYDFQFAYIIALLTLAGLFFTKDERRWKGGVEVYLLSRLSPGSALPLFSLSIPTARYRWCSARSRCS